MINLTVKRLHEVRDHLKIAHTLLMYSNSKVPLPVQLREAITQNQSTLTRVKKLIDEEMEDIA